MTIFELIEDAILDAALMLLAVLPERIRDAYLNYAKQIDYSIEMVLEMALADFLDPDSLQRVRSVRQICS
jgi:hypothetical protein